MTDIYVTYDSTDVEKLLRKIIKDPNSEEFIKLLTPLIINNSQATNFLFKLLLGHKLPEIISDGTLCKISVNNLVYGDNKDRIRKRFADADDKVVVSVIEFRGYHSLSNYYIKYFDIDEFGNEVEAKTFVEGKNLEIIEEF